MHKTSREAMTYFRDKYLMEMKGCTILDVGSRNVSPNIQQDYRYIFEDDFKYVGMDIEPGHNVDIVGWAALRGKLFDVVISGQCMEHVARPWEWLSNLVQFYSRFLCVIAPHTFKEHRFPIDSFRYFPDGMRSLFEFSGIKEVEIFKNKIDTVGIGTK